MLLGFCIPVCKETIVIALVALFVAFVFYKGR
jgi:hypothetical protein